MTTLACTGLTRRPFFEAVTLALGPGEIAVLRGPSGGGKTLFLRALADLDPVDEGEVTLSGVRRAELRPAEWRRRVLYLHQEPVRLGETVGGDLERVRPFARDAQADPERVAARVGLPSLEARTDRLSGGELQRLALARAWLVGPDVMLLDEPTTALDEPAARELERLVVEWAGAGPSALWVTHDPGLAPRLGAREVELA